MSVIQIIIAVPVGVLALYVLFRIASAAYFQSRSDYERTKNGRS